MPREASPGAPIEEAPPSSLDETLRALNEVGPGGGLERFAASLSADWIDEALAATGSASVRRRKLPADMAVWMVIGMCLFADRSIVAVVEHLRLLLPGVETLVQSSIPAARRRLGSEPLCYLFNKVADVWSRTEGLGSYAGLDLYGIDSTHLRLQDTDEIYKYFGKPGGRGGKSDAGYPQLRLATLMNLSNRLLAGAEFGPWSKGEQTLAKPLAAKIPGNSLTIFDRGFYSYEWLDTVFDADAERHVMLRARKDLSFEVIEILSDGSALAALRACKTSRRDHPDTREVILVRVIEYQHPGGIPGRLFVTLMDPVKYPAKELIKLYHERWELEVGYDELKTDMLHRKECLRSKTVDGVKQEVWGQLLTYNLVRREMLLAAQAHKVPVKRVSFKGSLLWIRDFFIIAAATSAAGTLPRHLGDVRENLKMLILPKRRSERRYPRHVKIKMSNYKRNRGKRASPAKGSKSQGENPK